MREIEGYEGLYAITSCGKVWSYKSQKFLKGHIDKCGYIQIGLTKEKEQKFFYVHRLVAQAYLPNPDNLSQIDHIDGNKIHNWINNLQWITNRDNLIKRGKIGKHKRIHCIETGRIYKNCSEAARAVGLACHKNISGCCKGYRQTAGGYHWEYVD